jgi:hypothetical protein
MPNAVLTLDWNGARQVCSTCKEPCTAGRGLWPCTRCHKMHCVENPACVEAHKTCARLPPPPGRKLAELNYANPRKRY